MPGILRSARLLLVGLTVGVLLAVPAGFAGGKLARLTNPLAADVDAAGHSISGVSELKADRVTAATISTTTQPPAAAFTGHRDGWGAVDATGVGTYTVETLEIPAGSWYITAPVRFRWGPGSFGPNIEWGHPDPPAEAFELSDHIDLEQGDPGDPDSVYPLELFIRTTAAETLLPILVTTGSLDTGAVVDGDSIRVGFPAGAP